MNTGNGKSTHLAALSNGEGVIAALALDQRGSLKHSIAAARGAAPETVGPEQIAEFKTAVSHVLSPYASAILLDVEFGLPAARARHAETGLLLAYEKTGYDNTLPGRRPELLDGVSAMRIVAHGADAVKILLYYNPSEAAEINDLKHAFVERAGAECAALDIPFFLELVNYDPAGGDVKGFEYAPRKPAAVRGGVEEFSKPQYRIDVLKIEVPVNLRYVPGNPAYTGQAAYSREQALAEFRAAGEAARQPFIYLSAGVSNEEFVAALHLAAEARSGFSGVLCGRATWKGGVAVYATGGRAALEDWLGAQGVKNITAVNDALAGATPWSAARGQASAIR